MFMFRNQQQKYEKPKFIHDNMHSVIPEIPMTEDLPQEMPEKKKKEKPIKGSGKKYEVLPHVGDFKPLARDIATERPNPCIEALPVAPMKKSRVPLACLDMGEIQKNICKAEKKEKKKRKNKPKLPPSAPEVVCSTSPEDVKSTPEVHIPQPPPFPLDLTKARRIVQIKEPCGIRYLEVEEYIAEVTSGYWPW